MSHPWSLLRDGSAARSFSDVPDDKGYWYAVWVDAAGAAELSNAAGKTVEPGILYAGECPTQSLRRHLAHSNIGSLTLMYNLAALLRTSWRLTGSGLKLDEPGRTRLLNWMSEHLTATFVPGSAVPTFRELLVELDPPLRLQGYRPARTPLRMKIREERRPFA